MTSLSAAFGEGSRSFDFEVKPRSWYIRAYTKLWCISIFALIFLGGLVKSHEAGLSVPDWPTSYGYNMFLFPPSMWVGNIFYEHLHRLAASLVGLLTVVLAIWMSRTERRALVRLAGICALVLVVIQGTLGGLTVLYQLPDSLSIGHGVLAQTFLCLSIFIVYCHSLEFQRRSCALELSGNLRLFQWAVFVFFVIYGQLVVGAVMRHAEAGLAIPDFPRMGGVWVPLFDTPMLEYINNIRASLHLAAVTKHQVFLHFIHRLWGVVTLGCVVALTLRTIFKDSSPALRVSAAMLFLTALVQFLLGIATITSVREPYVTSAHVVGGALLLASSLLMVLRAYPLRGAPLHLAAKHSVQLAP